MVVAVGIPCGLCADCGGVARQNLPKIILERLESQVVTVKERDDWKKWLTDENITSERHQRIVTEGALIGGLLAQGIPADFGIVRDDAGQFNVFDHALCWIHADREINRLLPMNNWQVQSVEKARDQVWTIYRDLKAYKLQPQPELAQAIRLQFTDLVESKTEYAIAGRFFLGLSEGTFIRGLKYFTSDRAHSISRCQCIMRSYQRFT